MSKYDLLIDKFIKRTISPKEREDLKKWVLKNEANTSYFKACIKQSARNTPIDFDSELAYQRFLGTLKSKTRKPKYFQTILKYAAVLTVLFTIGFFAKQQLLPDSSDTVIEAVENTQEKSFGNDIIIKLADGTTKVLNSENNQKLTDAKGNVVARKGANSLVFDEAGQSKKNTPIYNEVFIPFGQTFKLKLSDGTQVWLNAGSKLRFPQNFIHSEKNRVVYLEGEAFFDVAKDKNQPFIVNTQEVDIKVLGTKFNVSSYETDDNIATTLVEGAVEVYETRTPENGILLNPSFQANYDKFGNVFGKEKVDTDIYTAWTDNRLVIDHLKFSEILVRLERRYSVKFVNKAESLNEEIYKGEFLDEPIESVLKTISLSTPFNYEINQNIITITR